MIIKLILILIELKAMERDGMIEHPSGSLDWKFTHEIKWIIKLTNLINY